MMSRSLLLTFSLVITLVHADLIPGFRPPAIPIFALSPNLQGWLRGDSLTDQSITNWFNTQNSSLTGYVQIDDVNYRWMGLDIIAEPFINYFAGQPMTDRSGTDRPGSPVNLPLNSTATDCAVLCALDAQCDFWSFLPTGTGACQQDVPQCSLRTGQTISQPDRCRSSGLAIVHFDSYYVNGIPSSDMAGNDLREFDMGVSDRPEDCAKQCWSTTGCDAFVFAHVGCDGRQNTHCWLKSWASTPTKRDDCRQAGFGPQSAGWSSPDWSYGRVPVIQQTSVRVQPTQTIFTFENEQIVMTVTFTQPAFADDMLAMSREQVYITVDVQSNDGKSHNVLVYLDAASDLVTSYPSSPNDAVAWTNTTGFYPNSMSYSLNVVNASVFGITGDYTRSNWGELHLMTDSPSYDDSTVAGAQVTRAAFLADQNLPSFDTQQPRLGLGAGRNTPVIAFVLNLSVVNASQSTSGVLTMFYDELESLQYFGNALLPLWSQQYGPYGIKAALSAALSDYTVIKKRADKYDADLIHQMSNLTNDKYATLLSLIHRQVIGASVITWNAELDTPMVFIKEMSTGGVISTVDVVFPGSPFYIALAPETLQYMLLPILVWANNMTSNKVTIDWAPHDLGEFPVANANAANQEEMPLEESGNMLLMLAALAQRQDGDITWLKPFQHIIGQWASFLNSSLPDPQDQLCTDDFLGPSPHNINLATKGIIGMNAYAILLRYWGLYADADEWDTTAKQYAEQWQVMGLDADTTMLPHYKQRYDQNSTWSTKYNLIWQYLLNVDTFPDAVRVTENAFYQSQAHKFGIPLDNRGSQQKADWFSWMGALAFDNAQQQGQIIDFLYTFAHSSPAREPFSDLYDTDTMNLHGGFIARFVMGGLYSIPLLNAAAVGNNNFASLSSHPLADIDRVFPSSSPKWRAASE